jgi:hypothetical protein
VTEGLALALEILFEREAEGARAHLEDASVVARDTRRGEVLQVEHDGARVGEHAATHARACAERHEGHTLSRREGDDGGDVFGRARPHDDAGQRGRQTSVADADVMARPEIPRVREAIHVVGAAPQVGQGVADERGDVCERH